jgi:hypothetical protein
VETRGSSPSCDLRIFFAACNSRYWESSVLTDDHPMLEPPLRAPEYWGPRILGTTVWSSLQANGEAVAGHLRVLCCPWAIISNSFAGGVALNASLR